MFSLIIGGVALSAGAITRYAMKDSFRRDIINTMRDFASGKIEIPCVLKEKNKVVNELKSNTLHIKIYETAKYITCVVDYRKDLVYFLMNDTNRSLVNLKYEKETNNFEVEEINYDYIKSITEYEQQNNKILTDKFVHKLKRLIHTEDLKENVSFEFHQEEIEKEEIKTYSINEQKTFSPNSPEWKMLDEEESEKVNEIITTYETVLKQNLDLDTEGKYNLNKIIEKELVSLVFYYTQFSQETRMENKQQFMESLDIILQKVTKYLNKANDQTKLQFDKIRELINRN